MEREKGKEEDRQIMADLPPEHAQAHFVYMLQCANGSFYTGYTTNVDKRVATHNAGKGARYTRAHLPVTLLASWSFPTKRDALRAEYAIKQLTRQQKVELIKGQTIL
jgi:putative endonuclease